MHPDIEEALNAIARLHGKQVAACEALRDLMLEMVRPWRGRLLDPARPEDALLAALLARSAKTFWAVIELARLGFGEQGMMLNRSLFEDMVDAHWITLDPELAKTRYAEHHDHGQMIMFEALAKHPTLYDAEDIPVFAPERRKDLDGLFGAYGHKSWTGIPLHRRIEVIEHLWTDDRERGHLRFFGRIVQRMNNQQLHTSAEALNRTVRSRSDAEVAFQLGPSDAFVEQALFGAFWTFWYILRLILDHFDFETTLRERLDAHFNDGTATFRSLTPEELQGVGRNDPCPCGSGKKYKHCHGA
jgi:SEC-C motif/Family of unknown function (DUF5677)